MKQKNFITEIQTEDLPSRELKNIAEFFYSSVKKELNYYDIQYKSINLYYTSKKIALKILSLLYIQTNKYIRKIGPLIEQAFSNNGNITPLTRLWLQSHNISIENTEKIQINKKKYLNYTKKQKTPSLHKILAYILSKIIKKIPFKKSMIWNTNSIRFSRPILNIMSLLNHKIISLDIPGITYKNISHGHFLMAPEEIIFTHADQYTTDLFIKKYIIINYKERKKNILIQLNYLSKQINKSININKKLLEETTASVEWPIAYLGQFKKKYLKIPPEILINTIENNQKYFPLYNKEKNTITNKFIFISNVNSINEKKIIRENEQVLRAKLSNINFFISKDQKIKFSDRLYLLKNISFQKNLGSMYDKTLRIKKLSQYIAKKINTDTQLIKKSAILSKCDLTTNIITECTALQGIIGMYYALNNQENKQVSLAIKEHYLPNFSQSSLPTQKISCVLSIADKIDTIVGIFSIDKQPTNHKDPFALRRASIGIIRIIIEKKININLYKTIQKSKNLYKHIKKEKIIQLILNFIFSKYISLYSKKYNKRIIQSVLSLQLTNILDINKRIDALTSFQKTHNLNIITVIYKRINNIISKTIKKLKLIKINTDYLYCQKNFLLHENKLIKQIKAITKEINKTKKINYLNLLININQLCKPIEIFFQKSFINDPKIKIRSHRIFILKKIKKIFLCITDFSHL
ncbi:Glycine--tRNA ligase beta subunit [Buchnera aphidicola (Cinara kochiana kochiana)]|uniref:Glycine--tRNA ligase beta subunit n=1 Tax=Buchnera aphidicola (Cinara kochiana kochiana) TaxID=2518976 RepID=A0A451D582_9GAMM|nr:glycine--tRNA ligase subunit beta [Buchnera aphidicola]VFP81010.1 Glycine--tRNA ligase beta subunit [Buchnera aphidicola (Cinara kochiana kochiana)]